MGILLNQIAILGLLMLIGNISSRKGIINRETGLGLGSILTNIAMPATILKAFMISFESNMLADIKSILFYSTLIHLFTGLLMLLVLRNTPKEKKSSYIFGMIFTNTVFMGLPLISEIYGDLGFLYGSIYVIPFQILFWTLGIYIISGDRKEISLKKIIKSPSIIAIIIGIIIFITGWKLPYVIEKTITMISLMTTPMSMFILGEKSTSINLKMALSNRDTLYGLFVKLLLIPIITISIFAIKGEKEILRDIFIMMQAMPPASILIVLAEKYNKNVNATSEFIILAHILSLGTIPLIIYILSLL